MPGRPVATARLRASPPWPATSKYIAAHRSPRPAIWSITGSGQVDVDYNNIGGSSLTIGGNLSNASTSGYGLYIGNSYITSASTVTVDGSLSNGSSSYIQLTGSTSTSTQATLDVTGAAGFGTAGVETGNVYLRGDLLLEFGSGQINTIDGTVYLYGPNARIADAGATGSNSALTGLSTVAGNLYLYSGESISTSGNLSITGSSQVMVDYGYSGGSSLTIGGNLSNSGSDLYIGDTGITSASTVTVNGSLSNASSSTIYLEGSTSTQATLDVTGAAGIGTAAGVESGYVYLQGDSLLEFGSGQISAIDGRLYLYNANSLVADAGATGSNSALTGLSTVAGDFEIYSGSSVTTSGNLSITGTGEVNVDYSNSGGSSLTIGGNLSNTSTSGYALTIGDSYITSASTVTVDGSGGVSNTGEMWI